MRTDVQQLRPTWSSRPHVQFGAKLVLKESRHVLVKEWSYGPPVALNSPLRLLLVGCP
ncbi:Transposable element tcb1 transposase [Caligus rogercresseyi]|uniref:Transposable element tcb1 transposase n=1 Tax=Caligus rogercresseyi TaxID=217165 RepID=A0A7T8K0E9_CALRO|nr:Transposable element tcb1 transposase [Caligus rogercresseyi]